MLLKRKTREGMLAEARSQRMFPNSLGDVQPSTRILPHGLLEEDRAARMFPNSLADPQKSADAIRRIGEKNAPGDSILAHIEPEEAALLKRRGGSGEIDPETGLPHFARDPMADSSDPDEKEDDSPEADGGWQTARETPKQSREIAEANRNTTKTLDRLTDRESRNDNKAKSLSPLPSIPNQPLEDLPAPSDLMPYQEETRRKFNWGAAGKGASIGNKLVPGVGLIVGGGIGGLLFGEEESHLVPYKEKGPRALIERDSNKDGIQTTPKAPVSNETETAAAPVAPAAPTFDDFVAKARKRKNYLSTILAGNVSTDTPQGKKLYGS
jgi:hypothetical protein